MAEHKRTGRTVALVGGAALAAWLLSRGNGWGFRSPGDGTAAKSGGTGSTAPCKVWIYSDGLSVGGVATDLPTVVDQCRAVGTAEVGATGDAITGVIQNVLKALHAAGVKLLLPPSLDYLLRSDRL